MPTATLTVPFLDLRPSHEPIRAALLEDIDELLGTGAFTNGPQVAEFEGAFASFCGRDHCVGLASGLDALRLALTASGIEPGDEVIVPANTFVATAEAVTQAGGVPALADATEMDYNLDPDAVSAIVGPRTRFLMPVHLYGQMADMRALNAVAEKHRLTVIEDACQAHGATRDGLTAGAASDAAAFSFYPGKNLGAIGDAGALVTQSSELDAAVRALREHGQRRKYHHDVVGWTSRLDTIQAVALLHKLPHLHGWNESGAPRRPPTSSGWRESGTSSSRMSPGQRARLAPLRRAHRRRGRSRGVPRRARDRDGQALPAADPPHGRVRALGPHRGSTSRYRSGSRASASRCRSSQAYAKSSSTPSSVASRSSSRVADAPANDAPSRLISDVTFGDNVIVQPFTNLYGCSIGDNTRIGPFVEVQRGAVIGANCKIQSHTFVCDGVTLEDEVFVGHGVMFVNDKRPRATTMKAASSRPKTGSSCARSSNAAPALARVRSSSGASGSGQVLWSARARSSRATSRPGQTVAGVPARVCEASCYVTIGYMIGRVPTS